MISFLRSAFFIAILVLEGRAFYIPKRRSDLSSPIVDLQYGSFQGGLDVSNNHVQIFLGMPYAQAPTGDLRFRKPVSPSSLNGIQQAVQWGHSCPQQNYTLVKLSDLDYSPLTVMTTKVLPAEDCLFVNVFRPTNIVDDAQLPVIVWIYGGAFETGDASAFNATSLVTRSVAVGQPVIYVSFNYRLNGFGFLGGQEVADAGVANLGLYDQRMALEWVQTNIRKFGGDPTRVTLWGQSAGSVSITSHLVTNPGASNNLFHGAIMHSSFTSPMLPTTHIKHQSHYDFIVDQSGCSGQNSTLDCLRKAPYDTLMSAINQTPGMFSDHGLNLTFGHSVDGQFFDRTLKEYIQDGIYAQVPIVFGTNDDEGTLFSLAMMENVTTTDQVSQLIEELFLPGVNETTMQRVLDAYPEDPAAGSPFDTPGISYDQLQFKRLAAFQDDFYFQAARRTMFSVVSKTQNVWSFLWKRDKNIKYLGSVHVGELPEFYGVSPKIADHVATDIVVNFVNTLNPNTPESLRSSTDSLMANISWPMWSSQPENPPMFLFSDNSSETYGFVEDNFRSDQIQLLADLQFERGL